MANPIQFLKEVRNELKKVTWPTRRKAINLTMVVIIVSLIVSLYLGLLDLLFSEMVRRLVLA